MITTTAPRMNVAGCLGAIVLAAWSLSAGCIAHESVPSGQLDAYWRLQPDVWPNARVEPVTMGSRTFPSRWIFRQEPNLILSTVSLVRAMDRLQTNSAGEEIVIAISPEHTRLLADTLADIRRTVEEFSVVATSTQSKDIERWASATADVIVAGEKISRLNTPNEPGQTEPSDPAAWTAGPVIAMFSGLMSTSDFGPMGEMYGPAYRGELREAIAWPMLRVSFAVVGRQLPPMLGEEILHDMKSARQPEDLKASVKQSLLKALPSAPKSQSDELSKITRTVLRIAPSVMKAFETFLRQWDQMDRVEVEVRTIGDEHIVSATFHTRPGRELRFSGLTIMQPDLVFRGGCRMTVLPESEADSAISILMEPLEGTGCEVQFNGLGWAMVRLLAIPVQTSVLREIRIWNADDNPRTEGMGVSLVMQASNVSGDNRRQITFTTHKTVRTIRTAFEILQHTDSSGLAFTYLMPDKMYVFRRSAPTAP